MLTALLQPIEGMRVHLYEKRSEYTRKRMVELAPYLVADSIEAYETDAIDGDSIGALFDPEELVDGLAFRRTSTGCSTSGRSGSARSTRSSSRSAT
jgi:hypothetical protein